ncbi:MAG: sugar ABC transporter ATP-binding protein [Clostridia bacterium]|nr:sugar ABC transporter ATP-binding protein [Clostridia bacterium]
MGDVILRMENIDKIFGTAYALRNINFELCHGEVHALLGENGAGKSTLIKILGGIYQPNAGRILINGTEVKMTGISEARAHGIGIIHQEIVLVPYLTVAENIFLGREPKTKLGFIDKKKMNAEASRMVSALGLDIDVTTVLDNLTIAQQQMVEIVKASSFNVKILVMDEPTSSLSDEEVEKLFVTIERLKKDGVSIIYISHRMDELFRISDRVTVIRDGTYVGTKITKETNAGELVSMMVGRTLESFYTRTYNEQGAPVLEVKNLCKYGVFKDISFTVHAGEILGFSGLVGAGRSEIMSAVFGADGYDSGEVYLNGEKLKIKNPAQAIAHGISLVPEDRKKQGLVLINSCRFNMVLASLKYLMNGIFKSNKKIDRVYDEYSRKMHIKAASPQIEVGSLSGGNQQKVVLGKWLATKPKVLILDEPTRGVDVGAKQEIYTIMNDLAKEGLAIIMISSELPEIINMCDRVCVVHNGDITACLEKDRLSQETIMHYATGGDVNEG